jgi:hypothetical protein
LLRLSVAFIHAADKGDAVRHFRREFLEPATLPLAQALSRRIRVWT